MHVVHVEVGRALDDGVPLAQELYVASIEVVLPEVGGQPGAAIGIHTPESTVDRSGNTPDVRVVMGYPSATPVHILCSLRTRFAQVAYHGEERLVGLCKVAYL